MKEPKKWIDETGIEIPLSRITNDERAREAAADKLLKLADKESKALAALKSIFREICTKVYQAALEANKMDTDKKRKGNFTWFNFDRSIKVETSINEQIAFDEMLIGMVKEKLMEILDASVTSNDSFIKALVMEAFQTSGGKLDARKVMGLIKYRSKIKDPRYAEAMDMLEKSINRPSSKTYFRIWKKDTEGEYQSIDLNFSSISIKIK